MIPFKLSHLDHVALRVRDIGVSVEWYRDTLGLQKFIHPSWGSFPIMMLAGESGVALFPLKEIDTNDPQAGPDHFAFRVDDDSFEKVQLHFEEKKIPFTFQDHKIFQSIYLKDPDGYTVELTKQVIEYGN